MDTSKLSHNTLKYWLGCIVDNGNGLVTLTHWEIDLIVTSIIDNFGFDTALMIRILPLLCILKQRDKSHKHKRLVASFTLKLIDEYEQLLELSVF